MKKISICILLLSVSITTFAQSYEQEIKEHREKYKQEFSEMPSSPIKKEDIQYLRWFDPNESFRVTATFTKTENAKPFEMTTMNGGKKEYIEYGTLSFMIDGKPYTLRLYQGIKLMQMEEYKDHLFLPFTDMTTGDESYGGGRYLDFRMGDIKDGKLILDFNKAYNPYCAYASGYSCPKPPEENNLKVEIKAGEKDFGKKIH